MIGNAAIRRTALLFGLATCLSLSSFAQNAEKQTAPGISVVNLDRSVQPGDDFYRFANGGWLKRTEIPADRSSIGVFAKLRDLADKRTAAIIEEAAKANAPAGSDARKIADLYNSYMNEDAIEKKGLTSLRPHLDAIKTIRNKQDLSRALGATLRYDVDPLNNTNFHTANLFGMWVAQGLEDTEHYYPYLLQGGLTLPDCEYYLSNSEHMRDLRAKYKAHVAAMFRLSGFDNPEMRAARVLELEHAIASKHVSAEDSQEIHKANNMWTPADFKTKAPGLDWDQYFLGAGLSRQQKFMVWQPTAFAGESALVASVSLDTWKDWLAYHLVEEYAGALPKALADERFAFFGKVLSGAPQQRPRWQRGVGTVNGILGDAVGQIYAKRHFSPEAKAMAQDMVRNIIEAFRTRVDALTWMSPETKKEAKAKLDTLYVGIGYPEKYQDYSKYEVKADDLFGNLYRAGLFEYQQRIERLGKPVDKQEWSMTPQTVNAVNLPLQNALNFPAAILEAPFFDPKAPAAANYGAIGAIIAHEISHSFDTLGSTFDSQGRLRNWWTPEDLAHFEKVTAQLAKQYDTYKPFPDLGINGHLTLAENIADLAGIAAAYGGYRASLKGQPAPEQDGFSGDQQFFLAYGQNWASKAREAALRQQIMTDPHSPGEYRAANVRNVDAWYTLFDVKPGQKLYLAPEQRVRIW